MSTPKKQGAAKPAAARTEPVAGEAFTGISQTMIFNGKPYQLKFNNMTMVEIENLYREKFGRVVGLTQIFAELDAVSYTAVMVVYYAAMLTGGNDAVPEWDEFMRNFQLNSVPAVQEALKKMASRALPEASGEPKNAQTPPDRPKKTTASGHGRG